MNPIEKIESKQEKGEKQEVLELKNFPESVRALFDELPPLLKEKILPQRQNNETNFSSDEQTPDLEKMIASFSEETREDFIIECLNELFKNGNFKDKLTSKEKELSIEIERLLNLLWQNRGKRAEEIQVFNQEYYDTFFKKRNDLVKKIEAKRQEISTKKESIEKTKKQIRATNQKMDELRFLEEEERELTESLKKYDDEHNNSDVDRWYSRDISSRQKKEKEWTTATVITSEYLDPIEFATAVSEQLDRTFRMESSIMQDPERKWMGRTATEQNIKHAEKIVHSISETISNWCDKHENDDAFKTPAIAKQEERQTKTINYFISLIDSYKRFKEANATDEDMLYTIRQMEISLRMLKKIFNKA